MFNRYLSILIIMFTSIPFHQANAQLCQDKNVAFTSKLASYPGLLNLQELVSHNYEELRKNETIKTTLNQQHCDWLKERDQWLEQSHWPASDLGDWSKQCAQLKTLYSLYIKALNQQNSLYQTLDKEPSNEYPAFIERLSTFELGLVEDQWSHQVKDVDLNHQFIQTIENHYSTLDDLCGTTRFTFFTLEHPKDNQYVDALLTPELLKVKHDASQVKPYSQFLYQQGFYDYSFKEAFVAQTPAYLSLKHQFYEFTGGAHGNHALFLFSIDSRTGKKITLEDIIKPENKEDFLKNAHQSFIKDNGLKPKQSLQSQGYWFEPTRENGQENWRLDDDFYVPDNFYIDQHGLHFAYQTYEIAPYVFGHPQFTMNWSSLKPHLNEAWNCLPECLG